MVAAAGAMGTPAKAPPSAATPVRGSAVRAPDDEAPAASSADPAGDGISSYGALGLALLALVLWVGTRLRRQD